MELKDVVFALAHATGKTGRFTLIERWRNNERLLAPHENPLKILMKWGEYSSDVQFILQRSDQQQQAKKDQPPGAATIPTQPTQQATQVSQSQQQLLRQQQLKLNQLNNNHIAANGGYTNNGNQIITSNSSNTTTNNGLAASPTSPNGVNNNNNNIIPPGVISAHHPHINGNGLNNNGVHHHHAYHQNVDESGGSSGRNSTGTPPTQAPAATQGGPPPPPLHVGSNVVGEFNAADLRSSLDRKVNGVLVFSSGLNERGPVAPSSGGSSVIVGATMKSADHHHGTLGRYHTPPQPHHHGLSCADNQHHQLDTSSISSISSSTGGGGANLLLNGSSTGSGPTTNSPIVGISSNGALVPPPYRDPPPPRNSPLSHRLLEGGSYSTNGGCNTLTSLSSTGSAGSGIGGSGTGRKLDKDSSNPGAGSSSSPSGAAPPLLDQPGPSGETNLLNGGGSSETLPQHVTGYRELIQLIKLQREKINTQQADISKYDSEILYLEGRSRDQLDQLDVITQEINKTDALYRQTSEQLQAFQYVEEESELVRQQEKTLKSELTLLRSKLANSETELLQCKNRIRLLMDEILVEQRKYSRQYDPNRQQLLERHLMCEVDRLQVEIDLAVQSADQANKAHDKLRTEVSQLEAAIADKKKQVERLVHEMKEVNLQSLAVVPPADEVRHLLEVGSVKPGSTRRMIGSPRQLENAVPTSKNPHGVWV
ncbi:GATA zinc finger domain-containing protein 8 [Anopheles bellator]|uniref:GATA zinc finger domain-containing protein 8 n=1 Tax=Anopheles bellator TaxID=139047 RepID=UPI00264969E3|nr:GATA zinc finger domain-containing protein 8 [Anopheles bellator]